MEVQMQAILIRYQQENAKLLERAIFAEAGVEQLQQQVDLQQQMLEGDPATKPKVVK